MARRGSTENVRFLVPKGTRDLYDAAAREAGLSTRDWLRLRLREALEAQLEDSDVEVPSRRKLPVNPRLRRRLQPKIRVREELRPAPEAES